MAAGNYEWKLGEYDCSRSVRVGTWNLVAAGKYEWELWDYYSSWSARVGTVGV